MTRTTFFGDTARPPDCLEVTEASLIQSVEKVTLIENRDGKGVTWFHPRACMVLPSGNSQTPSVFMTMQEIAGSDFFGPVHFTESVDLGKTWSEPEAIKPLGQFSVPGHDGLKQGVCDVVPQYHVPSKSTLALGHNVYYRGNHFSGNDQLARFPVYAVRRPGGSWGALKKLEWNDPRGAFMYSNGCGQRVVMPDGDIIMSFTFGAQSAARSVAGVRCSFDGETLTVKEVGPAIASNIKRGLLEPSVTLFNQRFYMTMRAEDDRGYFAVSDDGLDYSDKIPWAWDDGEALAMSTTQQHWLTHSEGLYLVYTRKDSSNADVIRWRAPLFAAQVDTKKCCLIRSTEQVVLPLVNDGNNALMGNFHVTNVSLDESWVTVGEWFTKDKVYGDLLLGRIRWKQPNCLSLF